MKKTSPFEQNDQADEVFRDLKRMLSTAPVLAAGREGAAVALYCRDLMVGQHGDGGRATREGQGPSHPVSCLLPERGALRLEAELPALPEDVFEGNMP